MTFKEALRIKIGDRIYTHSGEVVVITGWYHNFENTCVKDDFYFHCIDTSFRSIKYRYNELCGTELCDEDKMFIEWYSNESQKNESMIPYLKSAFMNGFQCGYSHKQHTSCADQLQK
jgi:hypothetical protein